MATRTARSTRTVLVALRLILAGGVAAQTVKLPDLSGSWRLNKDASDDPQKVIEESRSSGGGGYGGGSAGGAGGGMGMGRGHGRAGGGGGRGADRGASSDPGRQDMGDGFAALQTLRIQHKEPMLTVTDAAGRERVVYTDGRKTEEQRSHGGTTVVAASWKDGRIQIVSTPETGSRTLETYAMTADGSQLTVTTTIEGGRRPAITIRRVYDSVKADSPKSAPPAAPIHAPPGGDDDDQSV